MLLWLAALAAGLLLALVGYARSSRVPLADRIPPALLRALAVTLLVALALDAPLGRSRALSSMLALDASASWRRGGDSNTWRAALAALDSTRRAAPRGARDSLLLFGDSVRVASSAPSRPSDRASSARALVDRAVAAGRPVVLVTDGELDDGDALRALPAGSRVIVRRAPARPDAALSTLELPGAAVGGDTIDARIGVVAGAAGANAGTVSLWLDDRRISSTALDALPPYGERVLAVRTPVGATQGAHVLHAVVEPSAGGSDAEATNDTLSTSLDVSSTASAVFVSSAPDQDSRFAISVLRGALAVPTRAYLRVAPGAWRVEGTLAPISETAVRAALAAAPLAVIHGDTAIFGAPRSFTRGALALIAPPRAASTAAGGGGEEWYATGAPASPLAASLGGVPWDSLPPLDVGPSMATAQGNAGWVGLEARRGRQGERRAAVYGTEGARRVVVVPAAGLWRWQFRGGVASSAFTAVWGGIFDWLGAERTAERLATPIDRVLRAGEPTRWRRGSAADSVVRLVFVRRGPPDSGAARVDSVTISFARGASVTEGPAFGPGVYDVRGAGVPTVLVVNASREWLPRRPTVSDGRVGGSVARSNAPGLRALAWPFVLALVALCAEWLLRRRRGLR